jgi:hypothetical protein
LLAEAKIVECQPTGLEELLQMLYRIDFNFWLSVLVWWFKCEKQKCAE